MVRPLHALLLLLFTGIATAVSQQVDCTIHVNYEAVATTHKDLLQNFERDITDYVNNYAWGTEDVGQKIQCTLNVFISSATGENRYTAQVFIGSKRPVFGINRNSMVIRLLDDTWEFTYISTRPLNHSMLQFDDLTTFLDFYMQIIIGSDYDTYEVKGGNPFFRAALDLAHLGQAAGAKGWDAKAGSFSRLQLMDEILSPRYDLVRVARYGYFFTGLDSLKANPTRAFANILNALETLARVRKQVDRRDLFIKSFFEATYLEIAEIFQRYPDRNIFDRLALIDPSHSTAYKEAKELVR
jgi:hypothetical protein